MKISKVYLLILFFLMVLNSFGQNNHKKKLVGKSVTKELDSASIVNTDYNIEFPDLNKPEFFFDNNKTQLIKSLENKKDFKKLVFALEDYIRHFHIQNFQRDHLYLWKLAQIYEATGQVEKAKTIYRLVLKNHRGKGTRNIQQHFDTLNTDSKEAYVSLEHYYELVEYRRAIDTLIPPRSVFLNMGELINDPKYPDYGPAMNVNGNMLLFTKRRKELSPSKMSIRENEDIYFSKHYEGFWDEAQPFSRVINTGCNEGSACMSRDGKTLYFARCKILDHQFECADCIGSCDIYMTKLKEDSTWSDPVNLGPNVNTTSWDSQPTLSHTEDTLYFSSDRLGGFGMSDIYLTYKTPHGWSKAENIGPVINTRGNEVSPFYHPKYKVLYFSSNGQLMNFGTIDTTDYIYRSFDIYKSVAVQGKFQEPKNIGPLVNSKGDEYYFTIDYTSKDLFYAKTEEPGSKNLDLFSFPLPMEAQPTATTKLKGSLRDSVTGVPFKGIVSIIDLTNGIEVAPKYIREDGTYEFDLINKNDYLLVIQGDDFFRIEEKLHISGDTTINLKTPAIKYNKWRFSRLEFDENRADIKYEMHHDLDKIVDFLIDHPTLSLKISGHTDSDGNSEQNLKLSQKRADAIKDYILHKGKIQPRRIEAIGYGNEKPIIKEVEDQHKHLNRRVEFEMIDPGKEK